MTSKRHISQVHVNYKSRINLKKKILLEKFIDNKREVILKDLIYAFEYIKY